MLLVINGHMCAKLRVVVRKEELALANTDGCMVARHGAICNTNIRRATAAYPCNFSISKGDKVKLACHSLQNDVRALNGRHFNYLPPLIANLYMGGKRRLAQFTTWWLVRVRAPNTLHLAKTVLCPTLEATNVNALNGAFAITRSDERVIMVITLSETDAANLGLIVADLVAPGRGTVIPLVFWSKCTGTHGQSTDTEFRAPNFYEITLRKCVESHREAPYGKPPLLARG